ncbi:DMT family transporter [Psychromicrobium lacuslunae]|uniref:DMT family transporter n=1 Tax=Psychromicrobium lacuslunae TaxID=1618207 RepID=UPI0009E3E172|nr:DMT family transporter [Psychromicrobium lacuslunae]
MRSPQLPEIWRRLRVDVLLIAVAVVWGSSYLAAKQLTDFASVPAILSLRFMIAALALLAVFSWLRKKRPGRAELLVGIILGFTQAAILLLETYGVSVTSATNAGLIISLTIIFTPILESAANRRWLPPGFFVAAVVAVVGVALLVSDNGFRLPNAGDLLMLAAAAVRAGHVTLMAKLTTGKSFDSLTVTLLQSAACAALFTAMDPGGAISAVVNFGLPQWLGVLYLGLACSVFAFLVQLWAIRQTSASRASLLMGTEPVWAVLIGITVGGELIGWLGVLGAVLIIAACYLGQRIEARSRGLRQRKRVSARAPQPIDQAT